MKSTFDIATRDELIHRIKALDENSIPKWGMMTMYQMVKHCTLWEEMILGRLKCKRVFTGRLIGRFALKNALKEGKLMVRNAPTSAELKVQEKVGDVAAEKEKWIVLLAEHSNFEGDIFIHPFFGKMTKEQVGYHAYMHTDHHLRQFNG